MPPVSIRSLLLPAASVALGAVFLYLNENLFPSELLIAAAGLAIVTGCSVLAIHPFIGNDTQGRKILESILSIIAVFCVVGMTDYFQIGTWDAKQIDYMAAILVILSFCSMVISILAEEKTVR